MILDSIVNFDTRTLQVFRDGNRFLVTEIYRRRFPRGAC